MQQRKRRVSVLVVAILVVFAGFGYEAWRQRESVQQTAENVLGISGDFNPSTLTSENSQLANDALQQLEVKGRAPKTGYKRAQFGEGWANAGQCDIRNKILQRDLQDVTTRSETDCTVLMGTLNDPYTGKVVAFQRGEQTSDDVQIDHVVALSDAWQKGAQQLSSETRVQFANDGLNLLAVDGESNQAKSDADAASWLPPNKGYRCMFIARQIAVKQKYQLWVTDAEKAAMQRVLVSCPDQRLPVLIPSDQ